MAASEWDAFTAWLVGEAGATVSEAEQIVEALRREAGITDERIDAEIARQHDEASKRIESARIAAEKAAAEAEEARAEWQAECADNPEIGPLYHAYCMAIRTPCESAAREALTDASESYEPMVAAVNAAARAKSHYATLNVQLRCQAAECNGVYFGEDVRRAAMLRLVLSDAGQPRIALMHPEARKICLAAGIEL